MTHIATIPIIKPRSPPFEKVDTKALSSEVCAAGEVPPAVAHDPMQKNDLRQRLL
jgi:hypothetical protein